MAADVKVNITGDASSFINAAKKAQDELDKVAAAADALAKSQAAETKAAAAAEKALRAQARASEDAARATEALTDIAIRQATEEEQLARALEKTRAEIRSLAATSGDATVAGKALAAAEKAHADALVDLRRRQDAARDAQEKATAATRDAETASARAGSALGRVSTRLDAAGSGAVKMRGALAQVSPEAAGFAGAVDDAADAVEGMGRALGLSVASMGAIGIAVAAAGAAYLYFSREVAKAEEAMAAASAEATAAQEAMARLADLRLSVTDRYLKATGQATAKDLELRDAIKAVTDEYGPRIAAEKAAIASAKASVESGKLAYTTIDNQGKVRAAATAEIARAEAALVGLTAEQGKYLDMTVKGVLLEGEAASATKARVKATKEASSDAVEAAKKAADAQEKASAAAEYWASELALVREGPELAELNQRILDIAEAERQGALTTAAAGEIRAAAWATYRDNVAAAQKDIAATNAAALADAQELKEIGEQMLADYADAVRQTAADTVAGIGDMAGSVGDIVGVAADAADAAASEAADALATTQDRIAGLEEMIADLNATTVDSSTLAGQALVDAYKRGEVAAEDLSDVQRAALAAGLNAEKIAAEAREKAEAKALEDAKKTALTLFRIQQAAQIAQAVLTAAAFVLQGGAQAGPIGAAVAAVAAAASVTAIVAAEPPSFHAGGIIGAGATALPDEVVLNRSAVRDMGGPAAANSLNSPAGRGAMGGVLELNIGRMQSREMIRTDIRGGGALPAYVRQATRRGVKGAGKSGALAAA